MKITKWIKIAAYAILVGMVLSIFGLGCSTSSKGKKLKAAKETIATLEQRNKELTALTEKLAQMDAVHCDVTIMVKNTAVMGSVQSGDLNAQIEQIATYTRGEILKMKQDTTYGTVRPKE